MGSQIFKLVNSVKKSASLDPFTVQVGAIAGNANNASNLNYVIIGLAVIIVVLVVITLVGNKK